MDEGSEGIDIPALRAYHKKKGTITGFPGAKTVSNFLLVSELSFVVGQPAVGFVLQSLLLSLNKELSYFLLHMCR